MRCMTACTSIVNLLCWPAVVDYVLRLPRPEEGSRGYKVTVNGAALHVQPPPTPPARPGLLLPPRGELSLQPLVEVVGVVEGAITFDFIIQFNMFLHFCFMPTALLQLMEENPELK